MAFPDFLELLDYWNEFPPVHIAIRGVIRPKGSTWNKSEKPAMNDFEASLLARGNVLPFTSLPPTIQNWLKETGTNDA